MEVEQERTAREVAGDLDASLLTQSDGYATGLVVYTLKQAGGRQSRRDSQGHSMVGDEPARDPRA